MIYDLTLERDSSLLKLLNTVVGFHASGSRVNVTRDYWKFIVICDQANGGRIRTS